MGSSHPSYRRPKLLSTQETYPRSRSNPLPIPCAEFNSHHQHKDRHTFAPSRAEPRPWTPFYCRRRHAHWRSPQGKEDLLAPTPPQVAKRRWRRLARKGDYPHLPHNRPHNGVNRHPRRSGRLAARTHSYSKLSRKRGTRTETSSPAINPKSHSYPHHPHGIHWGRT